MSSSEFPTPSFILLQDNETVPVEVWVDWTPAVDDAPGTRIAAAWREGNDLLLQSHGRASARRLPSLGEGAWEGLKEQGGLMVVCGPSGILGRRPFQLADLAPAL